MLVTVGMALRGLTTTDTVSVTVPVQPAVEAIRTLYVPLMAVVVLVRLGFCSVELKLGPLHE